MASYSSRALVNLKGLILYLIMLLANSNIQHGSASISSYSSIFNFGDSLTDTGNLYVLYQHDNNGTLPHFAHLPYGELYFHAPTGRCSDGRLIIDFIAEYLGKPYLKPYVSRPNIWEGVSYAVVGATVLNATFFEERGVHNPYEMYSLYTQLHWFKQMFYSSLQLAPSESKQKLRDSLVVMAIGGNDYNHALLAGKSIEEVQTFVTPVINGISSAITELINHGVGTFLVLGNEPIGCLSPYLEQYMSPAKNDYDLVTGCLNWLNNFAQKHNKMLQTELNRIQQHNPHATIIYADIYNAAMPFYSSPKDYGFTKSTLVACCGGGGAYNYNSSLLCGEPQSTYCDEPLLYANWDGYHLTEASNRIITKGFFEGSCTIPHFSSVCDANLVESS